MIMDILDNARIIKCLTDKQETWGLWYYIEEINLELERAKHKLECINEGKDCEDCDLWEVWCSISADSLYSIPDTETYQRLVEELNLKELHKWLIDDSTSKDDLQFRLNKIKGIVGSMWSMEDYVQVWCWLNGFEPTSELEIGTLWEIKRGIVKTRSLSNQLYEVATQLDKSISEDEIDKKVMDLNKVLLDWFKIVGHTLHTTYSMIEEAQSILEANDDICESDIADVDIMNVVSSENIAKAGRPKGKVVKSFQECFLVADQDREETMRTLESMLDGKRGKDLALIILGCIKAGKISKPSFAQLKQAGFKVVGNESGYNRFMRENWRFKDSEIDEIAKKFK